MTLKQEVLESIAKLPDSANLEDIMYTVYVIGKKRAGEEAVERGDFGSFVKKKYEEAMLKESAKELLRNLKP